MCHTRGTRVLIAELYPWLLFTCYLKAGSHYIAWAVLEHCSPQRLCIFNSSASVVQVDVTTGSHQARLTFHAESGYTLCEDRVVGMES